MSGTSNVKHALPAVGDLMPPVTAKTRATAEAGGKKCRFYKPLPKQFRRDGFNYRQIMRDGNAAVYEQTRTGCHNPSVCYEVIRIRRREGFEIDGRIVEAAEVYPNSEAWGVDGFTAQHMEAAFRKLLEIISRKTDKRPC